MSADRVPAPPTAANGAAVDAHQLTRVYGEGDTAVHALRGVTLAVEPGKLTAVMGPSGSGKSTLMHLLAALDQPTEGHVTIAGTRLDDLNDNAITKLRREHIGFIFQFFNLLPMLTAEENIVLPLTLAGTKPEDGFFDDLLGKVGLQDRRKHRPSELSGGQQQRVAIARALVSRPTRCLRRRADREPRLEDGRRDPRPAPRLGTGLRADAGHGHARRPRCGDRRSGSLPRRRPHRQGAARTPTSIRCSLRSKRSRCDDPGRAPGPRRAQVPDGADRDRDRPRASR